PHLEFNKLFTPSIFEMIKQMESVKKDSSKLNELFFRLIQKKPSLSVANFIKELPKENNALLADYLIWRKYGDSLEGFPQRYFARLFNRPESDITVWKKTPPFVFENIISIVEGRKFVQYSYTTSNFEKIKDIRDKMLDLMDVLGGERISLILSCYLGKPYAEKYIEFLKDFDENNLKRLKDKYGVLVQQWLRKSVPRPIKVLLKIQDRKYHEISQEVLSRLVGWGMSDGGISATRAYFFICGKKKDLEKIKSFMRFNIPLIGNIAISENFGGGEIQRFDGSLSVFESNESWILYVKEKAFSTYLYSYGLPKGQKVLQKFKVPNWINSGSIEIKKAFLNSMFESEGQKHSVVFNVKRNKIDLPSVSFGMGKAVKFKDSLVDFLTEIKNLLLEFNIKTSKVENPKLANIRKDGHITCSSRFAVSTSMYNILNFSKAIDYSFNLEKKEALGKAIIEAKIKIERATLKQAKSTARANS
ncbi:MAG: hypothetical protein NUV67_04355, partial [archaeon]|nr:hypothetical protein [archaeon]